MLWVGRWLSQILVLAAWSVGLVVLMSSLPGSPSAAASFSLVAVLLGGMRLATVVHECGHLLACLAFGVEVRAFHAGTSRQGAVRFRFRGVLVTLGLGAGGRVEHGPVSSARRRAVIVAAGSLANLIAAAVLLAVGRELSSPFSRAIMVSLALVAVAGASNLVPFRSRAGRLSDGARLLALGNGKLARALRAEDGAVRGLDGVTWRAATSKEAAEYNRDLAIMRQFSAVSGRRLPSELTERYLAAFRDRTVIGLQAVGVVAEALRQDGRITELLELFVQYPKFDGLPLPLMHAMHRLTYQVVLQPGLPGHITDLTVEHMDLVLDAYDGETTLPKGAWSAALHSMAVARLRQGKFDMVEELCQGALTDPTVASTNRATVLATVALARRTLGQPYNRLLAEAVALAPQADLVAEAMGRPVVPWSGRVPLPARAMGSTRPSWRRPALLGGVLAGCIAIGIAIATTMLGTRSSPAGSSAAPVVPAPPASLTISRYANTNADFLAFPSDGSELTIGDSAGNLQTWSLATRTMNSDVSTPVNYDTLLLSPNGRTAAYREANAASWALVNIATRNVTAVARGASGSAYALSDVTLATESGPGAGIQLWDSRTGAPRVTLTDPDSALPFDMAISPDGSLLAAFAPGNRIYLWDTATSKITRTLTDPVSNNSLATSGARVQFSADGRTLIAATGSGVTYVWHLGGAGHPAAEDVDALAVSPDGRFLASAALDGEVMITDVATGKVTIAMATPDGSSALSAAFSPDGTQLAVGDDKQSVYLWHIP
jgi:hypothetical protein